LIRVPSGPQSRYRKPRRAASTCDGLRVDPEAPGKRRLLEPIGNIPPAEAEERYYATLDEPAMAA
jgi:hypothetical protein